MAWIELHQTVRDHQKTLRLRERLRLRPSQAVGHLCFLWLWALDNAPEGDLSGLPSVVLARAADFPLRRADAFVDALVEVGFLERDGARLRIHDWEEYAGRYRELREKNRARQKRYRERNANVRVTNANVTGLPDQTIPDQTIPDQTRPDLLCGNDGGDAGADGRVDAFLERMGLADPGDRAADPALRGACDALTDELFRVFCARRPTELDRLRVFACVTD
ncbi:MAG: hypothetical protein IJ594_06820, partial [Oscillospiraceae bacterium]|nr:hypothetical protein [Oscillospiraceae bacterium]